MKLLKKRLLPTVRFAAMLADGTTIGPDGYRGNTSSNYRADGS